MKKTSTNNRRKKLPLLLGALLIISVAAYGTRAYFSDSAEQQANIALSLGDVDISMDDTSGGWIYAPLNLDKVKDQDKFINTNLKQIDKDGIEITGNVISDNMPLTQKAIENVRPGDSFTRNYKITNNGSLDVKIYLESELSTVDSPFKTTISREIEDGNILIKGATTSFIVTITVDPDTVGNDFNVKKGVLNPDTTVVDYLNSYLTVKAVQTNADETANETAK